MINLKVGDELLCTSNEGLMSVGERKTIVGLTEKSINFSKCETSWQSRDSVRWDCYRHIPKSGEDTQP